MKLEPGKLYKVTQVITETDPRWGRLVRLYPAEIIGDKTKLLSYTREEGLFFTKGDLVLYLDDYEDTNPLDAEMAEMRYPTFLVGGMIISSGEGSRATFNCYTFEQVK